MTRIGIIGSKGKMGRLFCLFFREAGCKVEEKEKGDVLDEKWVQKQDVLLICVPLAYSEEVICDLVPKVQKEQLILDIASLKSMTLPFMLKGNASVIGMHPMFGPSISSFQNQTFVLCPERPGRWYTWLIGVLKQKKAKILETSYQSHDRMMALIQAWTHFTNLLFAQVLKEEGFALEELCDYASPTFLMQSFLFQRILNQSPEMYADIQMKNPYFQEVLDRAFETFKKKTERIKKQDRLTFCEEFLSLKEHFASFLSEGQKNTDQFIKLFSKEKN